jgi:antitoxin component YwqK of YwqJK toxin-antitoxin module
MTFDNLKEMNGSPSMQVGVEFIFAECDIKIPDTMSAKVDSVSIEENEQMLYKFLSELRFNMKINLLTSTGKKFFSSDAIVTPHGDFKINYSENEKLMAQGNYAPENAETQFSFYYSNGITKRQEGTYLDGKKHGQFKEFYQTGLIKSVGHYQNNSKHDKKFQEFNDNGELKFFGVYENGKQMTNLCEWVETDNKKDLDSDINNLKNCIRYFDNGKKDPKQIIINKYDDMKIKSIEYWDDEKKHSTGSILHENGTVKYQGRTVNGEYFFLPILTKKRFA